MPNTHHRDNTWLQARVDSIWANHFDDAPTGYPITPRFGPRARYRFGSIYSRGERCHILVNGLFAHPEVPEYVVDATIAHELAHYVHGYGSGLRRLHYNPHRGGVVDCELNHRGFGQTEVRAAEWRERHWQDFYQAHNGPAVQGKLARAKSDDAAWDRYLASPGYRTEDDLRTRTAELARRFGFARAPFEVSWFRASTRRVSVSYRFRDDGHVRLHGTLANPAVPQDVVDYELMYWLAAAAAGLDWDSVVGAMRAARLWSRAQRGIAWRRSTWKSYCRAAHPLRAT